ncbi:DOMON-like domain-containing protein [Synechocystis sp. LKSZ1]|uniref:DOMON-like domain-containing protein n=1 Tax=Synechocystis sp. LKSZ1 TaxID=3144951 RepID=UPI00336BB6BA
MENFVLTPFTPLAALDGITLAGQVQHQGLQLDLCYRLGGDLGRLQLPPAAQQPERQDYLWQQTCLEFFLAPQGQAHYWEFNLSPAGHWNCYRFEQYRQGMAPEVAYGALPFQVEYQPEQLTLHLRLDLSPMLTGPEILEMGITAVLAAKAGDLSYWALTHPGPVADFHRRESFCLALAP